jgi:hypothetical protein
MGILSALGASLRALFNPRWQSRLGVHDDIEKCETLIADAAENGMAVASDDINAVKSAHLSWQRNTWTEEMAAAFYAAMARIVDLVLYPGPSVCEDLRDGMRLISHAAQTGKQLAPEDIQALANAREAQKGRTWKPAIEAEFYASMSRIARAVSPVIAETVGDTARSGARKAIRSYTRAAIVLTISASLLSCLLFVVAQASQDISSVVKENDAAALDLHNELQAHAVLIFDTEKKGGVESDAAILALQNSQPALIIKQQLQKFATNNRQLYADVRRINALYGLIGQRVPSPYKSKCPDTKDSPAGVFYAPTDDSDGAQAGLVRLITTGGVLNYTGSPFHYPESAQVDWQCDPDLTRGVLEVTLPLLGHRLRDVADPVSDISQEDVVDQGFEKIAAYQDIRSMAMYVHDIILAFVGAVTQFLLPILYASLGACASILRQLSTDSSTNMFHPEHSKVTNRSHVMTAIIVGISIGLFTDIVDDGKKVSPLAIAFVAGYASDKFFHYLDRLVESLFPSRPPSASGGQGSDGH